MTYEKAEAFDQIQEKEGQLYQELRTKNLPVKEFLKRDQEIDQLMMDIGEVFESLGDLEKRLLLVMDSDMVRGIIERRGMCAALSKKYGIQSRYIFIEYDDINTVPVDDSGYDTSNVVRHQIGDVIQRIVITQYINFREIAKDWTPEQIEELIAHGAKLSNPSETDMDLEI